MAAIKIPRTPHLRKNKLMIVEALYTEPAVKVKEIAEELGWSEIYIWQKMSNPTDENTKQILTAANAIRKNKNTWFEPLVK